MNTTNFHTVRVSYQGPTTHRGARVRMRSDRFQHTVTIEWSGKYPSAAEEAAAYLRRHGWVIIGKAEGPAGWDYVHSSTFDHLPK